MISVPEPKLARVADKGLNLQINIGVSDYGINIYRLYISLQHTGMLNCGSHESCCVRNIKARRLCILTCINAREGVTHANVSRKSENAIGMNGLFKPHRLKVISCRHPAVKMLKEQYLLSSCRKNE